MNIKKIVFILISYFACFYVATAQIDSTKNSLYLKCATEILINYPKDIDTTKITFKVNGGEIYKIISKRKIIVVPQSSNLVIDIFYNDKLLYNKKYVTRMLSKPKITCIMTKDKFPRRLKIEVKSLDNLFVENCPLDATYTGTFVAQLIKDREVVINNLFTDQKQELTQQEWFEIRELFKKDPTANWRIYIQVNSTTRINYKGETENATCPPQFFYNYTLESFKR